jgi:hypothetical protein
MFCLQGAAHASNVRLEGCENTQMVAWMVVFLGGLNHAGYPHLRIGCQQLAILERRVVENWPAFCEAAEKVPKTTVMVTKCADFSRWRHLRWGRRALLARWSSYICAGRQTRTATLELGSWGLRIVLKRFLELGIASGKGLQLGPNSVQELIHTGASRCALHAFSPYFSL